MSSHGNASVNRLSASTPCVQRASLGTLATRIEAHQPRGFPQESAQPVRGGLTGVECRAAIAPACDLNFGSRSIEGDLQRIAVRIAQLQAFAVEARFDQRKARLLPLRHELSVRPHDHPFAIMLKAHRRDACALERDAAAGLHG